MIKKYKNIIILFILITTTSFKTGDTKSSFYPIPAVDNMLFYIQRTINSNTIVYQLNVDTNGVLNELEPIKVYWIKYEKAGKTTPLTFIQKHYSYGIETKIINEEKKSYSFQFASYDKRQFYLIKSSIDNKYHVYGRFNDAFSVLKRVLIQIDGGSFWIPNVTQLEVYAQEVKTDSLVKEIIIP